MKINFERAIMIPWQTILVWVYALKHTGKDEHGAYVADGLRLWNPFSWVTIIAVFVIGLIYEIVTYVIDFIKDFNKNF